MKCAREAVDQQPFLTSRIGIFSLVKAIDSEYSAGIVSRVVCGRLLSKKSGTIHSEGRWDSYLQPRSLPGSGRPSVTCGLK